MRCKRCDRENKTYAKELCRNCYVYDWRENNVERAKEINDKYYSRKKKGLIGNDIPPDGLKKCSCCNSVLPEREEFFRYKKNANFKNNLYPQCRTCEDKKAKQYRIDNQEINAIKAKEHRKKLRENGICVQCGQRKAEFKNSSMCRMDYIKNICNATLRDSSRWEEIDNLLKEQNYKCALSGVDIDWGKRASIDHIIPRKKGGTHDIENLQMVHYNVNFMKMDMLMGDFLDMCAKILEYNK